MSDESIIDLVRATPPEVDDLLGAILRQQEADRDHWSGIQDAWFVQAKAEARAVLDGVNAALNDAEWGGTTRQYEATLSRIAGALTAARSGPVFDWYVKQFTDDQFSDATYPAYLLSGGPS